MASRKKRPRGFGSMTAEKQQAIARKGGLAISQNKAHMSMIGRRGGQTVAMNRKHMSEIGRKGGRATHHQARTPD